MIEYLNVRIADYSLARWYTHQPIYGFLCHERVSTQGDQVIQPDHAPPQLLIEQTEDEGDGSSARPIRDDDEYPLSVQRQRIASLPYQLPYVISR